MRLLLADDHGLFRDSMAVWLKQLNNNLLIDFADSYGSTLNAIQKNVYDLILIDLGMPDMQGIISVEYFCNITHTTPIIIVSADENPITISACIEVGAAGYVTKSSSGETILKAVKQVLSGSKHIPTHSKITSLPKLNNKQLQVLTLIIDGCSNKLISENLHLTEGTVKQYVSQLLSILDVDNRTQAAKKAQEIYNFGHS